MSARRARATRLHLWMNGLPVGYWEHARDGERLVYFDEWIGDPQGRPLSLSLPFTPGNQPYRGRLVSDYFDNLLPDSEPIRRRIAMRYRTGGTSAFALLATLGRDCVGALQMLPPDEAPDDIERIRGHALADADIARLLREVTSAPQAGTRRSTICACRSPARRRRPRCCAIAAAGCCPKGARRPRTS